MHASTLILLLLCATAAHAYPTAPAPNSPALGVAARSDHMLPPAPVSILMPMPMSEAVTNTAGRDPHAPVEKRQIHNADYHANGPPPALNPAPAPAPASAQEGPPAAAAPAATAAPSEPATKAARSLTFGPGPVIPPSSACSNNDEHMEESGARKVNKRSTDVSHHALAELKKNTPAMWPGWRRRTAEELTNAHNPALDHDALTRWSREEVVRMQAWSRANVD
ncbi:hypothetical protein B0H17DRAFT_7983 [Mycena rosella]|uniref:Uncharacterized protein n=1 Tax=Mycena rosella TaxID=1033263 RepID=A0AAD7GSM7_MYCRO|nr:hypothetical protein B0H17DRAFT_7983 [Mycena rosella]